jgi:predicted SAM-dependent methyltransferase
MASELSISQMIAMGQPIRLEIGAGQRPTPGYVTNDINPFDGIDIVANPWEIDLPDGTVEEVLALAVIEHLTYSQVDQTFSNIYRMLRPGGLFFFDVPEIVTWCRYVVDYFEGRPIPFEINHVFSTLYGWQRWPGDEHKSGWYPALLEAALDRANFGERRYGVDIMLNKGLVRNRMLRPHDAHIYCMTMKPVQLTTNS